MRLKHPQPFFCLCFFIQVTLAQPKNDYPKIVQRTNPKKYQSNNWDVSTRKPLDNKFSVDSTGVKLRHSSKFPHFDRIKSRIAGLDSSDSSTANNLYSGKNRFSDSRFFNSNSKWSSNDYPRLRHHGWSNRIRTTTTTTTTTPNPDDDLFNNYGELDGDEKMEDDYPEDIFGTLNDDDDDADADYGLQAEEPTSTERSTIEPRKYSSLSEYKWEQLGTMERVQQARRNYIQQKDSAIKKSSEESKTTAVVEHYIRVKNTGQCKAPIPKVIPVHVEYPDPSVTYIPHCTVLHRCAEDTGCCKYDTTCQYKERVEVSLYFYVKQIGADTLKVEKLNFYNHTECECKGKPQEGTEDQANTTDRQKRVADANHKSSNFGYGYNSGVNLRSGVITANNGPESLLMKCKCPKEFTPKIKYGSKCYCDCDNNNEDCLRMKKGKEYNSLIDRLCIQKRECGTVTCQYGPYNKLKGRCPRYDEA